MLNDERVQTTVRVPGRLLQQFDDLAAARQLTRSSLLLELMRKAVGGEQPAPPEKPRKVKPAIDLFS